MMLEIRLFATLKERAGQDRLRLEIELPATVAHLKERLRETRPELAPALDSSLVAVNKAFAAPDTAIQAGDEVALFPPVSGGNDAPYPTYFAISDQPLDINAIHRRITQPDVGAVISFTGFVRGQTDRGGHPDETLYLEYEAYQEMAEERMRQIAEEIWERWPQVKGVAIVQQIGRLEIGDVTTFVACAAGHRDQGAFAAARYGIDRLKEIVPVWKKEVGPDKSLWIEGDYRPDETDNR
jgi:molybdopterin synthase catalytic subunit